MATSANTSPPSTVMASPSNPSAGNAIMPSSNNIFSILPIELKQAIARCIEDDKDLVTFMRLCKAASAAIELDGCSFWRRRFNDKFETYPGMFFLSFDRASDNKKIRKEYVLRKAAIHVIDPVFQNSKVKPKMQFKVGSTRSEKASLTVLKNLIIGAFGNKKGSDDVGYESVNMTYIMNIVRKTNLLQILGTDTNLKKIPFDVSFLYAIQSVLAPALLSFDDWHRGFHGNFHECQIQAYADKVAVPIFRGLNGMEIDMNWLVKNIQFWRSHFLLDTEPLCPAFEALEDWERPQFWTKQLSQDLHTSKMGKHWKGSYAFVDRHEIGHLRAGKSGNGYKLIQDQLNGEEDPDDAFQNMEMKEIDGQDDASKIHIARFRRILNAARTPTNTQAPKTRAQKKSHGGQTTATNAAVTKRAQGLGNDKDEDFLAEFWLDALPKQFDVPGWARVEFVKYYCDVQGRIDYQALWAHQAVLLPGGRIMVGRWWCPSDTDTMYSGPFILWNVNDAMVSDDDDQSCVAESDGEDEGDEEIACVGKGTEALAS